MSGTHRSDIITARAPGKINVCFRVGRLQPDGTHRIATLYQAVSLYDTVTVRRAETFSVTMQRGTGVPGGERNLAVRAAKLLAKNAGVHEAVHLTVDKQIPQRAGMSGGSADAAAALVACNELWDLGLDRSYLQTLSLELGADVPFALEGGTAVGTGHGDEFSQALSVGSFTWVVVPGTTRLTEDAVVEQLDRHRDTHQAALGPIADTPVVDTGVLHAVRSGCASTLAEVMQNDLQMASLNLAPESREYLELAEREGALAGVTLATTAALALLVENQAAAQELRRRLSVEGADALIVEGPVAGAHVIDSAVQQPRLIL